MSFEQEHWHVLSPIGGHFSGKLMKLLASICQEYKKIFICFDNDPAGQKFQLKMARFLFSHNIPFVCGHTQNPDGTPAKYDVSDYYSHGGSLDELVASAIPGVYELAQSFTQGQEEDFREFLLTAGRYASESQLEILRSKCPLDADFVKACVKEAKRPPSERDIVDQLVKEHELTFQVGEGFYEYQHGVWNALPALAVEGYARELLGRHAISGRMSSCARHVQAIRWRDTPFNQSGHINLMNGMLDPVTGELSEHNPALYSNIQIPRIYDPLAVAPRFSQFLDEITGNDKQKRRLILQMMGSAFIRDARFQTGFMLMGNGANGKSVLIEIMRYVLDPRNCSDVDLSKFADPFEPLRLRHSLVNFCTETRVDLKGGEAAIKRVLSGETISAARKGVDAVEFAPTCKVICACNNFVASKDISYGFARKWKFIGFNQIFKDRDADLHLLDELKKEAAGIFNMMLEGYRDLIASGGYVTTDEEEQIRRDFMIQANPVTMFIGTELDDLHGTYSVSALYETHYIPWTEKARTGVLSLPNFGAVMKKLMPQIRPDVKFVAKRWANTWVFPDEPETPQDRLPGDYTRPERRTPPASQPAPVPEMPAPEIGEPEQSTPVAAPVSTSRKYPMTENQIGLANAIVASMKQAGINPGTPGSGNEWTTWDKQKSFGKSYSADSRGWCKAWERLKYALWENGYPSSTRHAIMYRVIFDEFNMYRADADPDPVIRALKEHPEYI
ncbi:MAG: toprim domain-containing protein [Synergistaceae bacterium]|nr:toprim domain-containing protein [Synergistaceae bacterium]